MDARLTFSHPFCVVSAACVAALLLSPARGADAPTVAALLHEVGIEPRDVGIQPHNLALMVGRRPHAELSHLLMCEPLRADDLGFVIGQELARGAAEHPADVLAKLSRYNRGLVRRGLIGDPLAEHKQAAQERGALGVALRRCGGPSFLSSRQLDEIPQSVQRAATVVLLTAANAEEWVRRARRNLSHTLQDRILEELARPPREETGGSDDPDFDLEHKAAVASFETELAVVAAQELLLAAAFAVQTLRDDPALAEVEFNLSVRTRWGEVILADARPTTHAYDEPTLLIIDVGGNDTYANAGAAVGSSHPVSIAIDLAGDDVYQASPDALGSFGAGILGVGLLWDDAGNDRYAGDHRSQGTGRWGVGVLVDVTGDDEYAAVHGSQGSAVAGYGVLIDRAGNDTYTAYLESQAYAGPNAGAALIDLAGDDRYVANDTDIRFPASQSAEHNTSMCQGAATGWRADYRDGQSVNGGVAVLLDAAGDDAYTCGVFGQGSGYWYGAGLLIDVAGDDAYAGHWYVQGAAAHYAVGVLIDRAGNDHYVANQNMSQGAGHDLSVGVLVDDLGNDVYDGTTLGLGAANAAGVGVFIDKGGDDQYRTPPRSCLGWVNSSGGFRGLFASYGLFFDLAGADTYGPRHSGQNGRAGAGDGQTWRSPRDDGAREPVQFGFGFDR